MPKLVVHMIANAHLDPVWMWTWPAGVDEAIATCRSACDMLDDYDELLMTRGEAWVYQQVAELDPALFARIRAHVDAGRWQVVNGWWIQPDTNLPTAASFRKQGAVGQAWFRERLGVTASVGYQVDSFGHCAMLPSFLRSAGMDSYAFMRPARDSMALPGNLFRWRAPDGESVTAFRIESSYVSRGLRALQSNIDDAIACANQRVGHSMAFFGVGDHGGGPSREMVEWIQAHRDYREGVELRFSHPAAFFEAVHASGVELPTVEGELGPVFVGCYTAVLDCKQQMRRAEHLLGQAEALVARHPELAPQGHADALDRAWRRVLFNQFHDIHAGTSIEPAYAQCRDELGEAKALASEVIVHVTRRAMLQLGPCERKRVVLHNSGDERFDGLVCVEPWLGADSGRDKAVRFTTEGGTPLPSQRLHGNAAEEKMFRFLLPAALGPGEQRAVEIHHDRDGEGGEALPAARDQLGNGRVELRCDARGAASLRCDGRELLGEGGIRLQVYHDSSSTWGHNNPDTPVTMLPGGEYGDQVLRLTDDDLGSFASETGFVALHSGPLESALQGELRFEHALVRWQFLLRADDPTLRMRLRVHWQGQSRCLKLLIPPAFRVQRRIDGSPGARLERSLVTHECPFHELVHLAGEGRSLSVLSQDVFGQDLDDGTLRLTLLRSPLYCQHPPMPIPGVHDYPASEQGEHCYEIAILGDHAIDHELIARERYRQLDPLWCSETSLGMPPQHYPEM